MELNGPGGWVDVTEDAIRGLRLRYGIQGGGPLDLVAGAGSMSFTLLNNLANSAGIDGYYTPGHAFVRDGFRIGVRARYSWRRPGPGAVYPKFIGWLDGVAVEPNIRSGRHASCTVTDIMEEFAREKPAIPVQVNKRADQVLTTLIAAMNRQPISTSLDVCDSTFPYAPDDSRQQPALAQAQRLYQSEFGRLYPRGDGTLRGEKRTARLAPLPKATFDADDPNTMFSPAGLRASVKRGDIKNLVRAKYHTRDVGATDTEVLFQHQGAPSVPAGATVTITGSYNDPTNRASRVAGTDMRTPVAGTDYTMNAAADGSGADLTSQFTVVAFLDSNTVRFVITNGSASTGFITLLRARGRGLYDYEPVDVIVRDEASIDPDTGIGESPLDLDMFYQADQNVVRTVAEYVLGSLITEKPTEASLMFQTYDDDTVELAMSLEPGDSIIVRESNTGVNSVFFINGVAIALDTPHPVFTWPLQRALVAEFFTLDDEDLSVLDVSTVLGPL